MAAIESGIRDLLVADVDVKARVSKRIYPTEVPQGVVYPALAYTRISGAPLHVLEGSSSLQKMRLQVDCLAVDYAGAKDLADHVVHCLDNYKGAVNGGTVNAINLLDEADMSIPKLELYRVRLDFEVWYSET